MSKGWIQFLLVAVPVLSLVGSWLALRTVARWQDRPPPDSSGTTKSCKAIRR